MTMTTISQQQNTPSFLAPAPAFSFFEQPEIYAPAPEVYEQWRTADLVPVYEGWYFHQPTLELIQVGEEEQALSLVDWERRLSERWHEEVYGIGRLMWLAKRPWWMF